MAFITNHAIPNIDIILKADINQLINITLDGRIGVCINYIIFILKPTY
jgi:hypothetical protein